MRPVIKNPSRTIHFGQGTKPDYTPARQLLIETLGSYCSYCESPITMDVPVEHKVPKSEASKIRADFYNLLPACHTCNSAKGARPLPTANEKAGIHRRVSSAMETMVWPDSFTPPMDGQGGAIDWREVDQSSVDTKTFTFERAARSQAELARLGLLTVDRPSEEPCDMVWIAPARDLCSKTRTRALNTINILSLNRHSKDDIRYRDRRVENRTAAWEQANLLSGQLLHLLLQVTSQSFIYDPAAALNTPAVSFAFDLYLRCAQSVGYWSIWMTVLSSRLKKAYMLPGLLAVRREILERALVSRSVSTGLDRVERTALFKGTDLNRACASHFLDRA